MAKKLVWVLIAALFAIMFFAPQKPDPCSPAWDKGKIAYLECTIRH